MAAVQASARVELYNFVKVASRGSWELVFSNAKPGFYDCNEDQRNKNPEYFLQVKSGDIDQQADDIDQRADESLSYVADPATRRVTFSADNKLWALKFPAPDSYRSFMTQLEDNVFQNTYGFGRDSTKAEKELGDFKNMLFNSAAGEAAAPMELDAHPDDPAPGELTENAIPAKADKAPIDGIVIGANASTYLRRGSTFHVMKNMVEGGVEATGKTFSFTPFKGSITPARTPITPSFIPSKVLLANGEKKMNMLSAADRTKLFHADVECQKIVSEWSFQQNSVNIPMADIAHDNKAAQLADNVNTLLSLDSNRLCRWDFRDPRGVAQEASGASPILEWTGGKDYSRGTNFTCIATSGAGNVVVGSEDGKVRLYSSQTLTQAKTTVPGLGKPITAVDVTYDGNWVLATTDDYLMVVKTSYTDAGKTCNGFTDKAGVKLALPRLLRLKPEDKLMTDGKPFKNGRFTWVTKQNRQEGKIVASCGKHTVVWNFRRVKESKTSSTSFGGFPTMMEYHMSAKDEDVVDSSFMHERYGGARGAALVATPHKVFTLEEK